MACLLPLDCGAQNQAPAAAASAASEAGAPASSAKARAMERARRAAEGPMRAILEAGKVRRRFEPDPAVEAGPARRRALAVQPAPAVPVADPGTARPEARAHTPLAQPPAVAARPAAPAAPPPPAAVIILTLPDEASPPAPARSAGLDPTAVAPVRAAVVPAAAAEMPKATLASRAPPPANVQPKLVRMVEPEVPPRLLDQLVQPEVTVEFTIAADGAVGAVAVLSRVPRQLEPILATALEQWRYEPSAAPRRHRVQLVFKEGL